jgi:hypothetical protein
VKIIEAEIVYVLIKNVEPCTPVTNPLEARDLDVNLAMAAV